MPTLRELKAQHQRIMDAYGDVAGGDAMPDATQVEALGRQYMESIQQERAALRKLADTVVEFVDKHDITCAETIYQTDRVQVDATTFIEQLVEIAGYKQED